MSRIEAKLDHLIELLINDSRYTIEKNGKVLNAKGKEIGYVRNGEARLRNKPYVYITYGPGQKKLKRNRIVFRKFKGELIPGMVIDHIDDNSLNDDADNLQQITQQKNMEYKKGRGV